MASVGIIGVGGTIELEHSFFVNGSIPTDSSTQVTVTVKDSNGATLVNAQNATRRLTGVYYYRYKIPMGSPVGEYTAQWNATIATVPVVETDVFNVTDEGLKSYLDMTPDYVRNFILFGIPLTDYQNAALTDEYLYSFIYAAIDWAEKMVMQGYIKPRTVVCNAHDQAYYLKSSPGEASVPRYDLSEVPYDYSAQDYFHWGYIQLRKLPVLSVQRVRLIYPTGQHIITYPADWIKFYPRQGQFQVVPTAGTLAQVMIGAGGQYLPLLSGKLIQDVPQLIWVDYKVGLQAIPADIFLGVMKKAAYEILNTIAEAKSRGVTSKSLGADGLSENINYGNRLYGKKLEDLLKDLEVFEKNYRNYYAGVRSIII